MRNYHKKYFSYLSTLHEGKLHAPSVDLKMGFLGNNDGKGVK